jgi:hypothetical protein
MEVRMPPEPGRELLMLPVVVYRVGNTCFSEKQAQAMIDFTNEKLEANGAGIEIVMRQYEHIDEPLWAYVTQDDYSHNVWDLLDQTRHATMLRIFLVKVNVEQNYGSWSFVAHDEWYRGTVFVTELYNDNSPEVYTAMGLLEGNDSLLHELGHVLMHEENHYNGHRLNFFHEQPERTDDTMFEDQIRRMRESIYLERASCAGQ